ncbi:MAG TPA: hypothetical protein EYN22_03510, partial [Nitrospinaceae bacterium]|nr:hypothetical protein [Nitrospinaceae bacterium]
RVLFSYDYTSHVNPYYSIHVRLNGSTPGRMYFIWNDGTTHVAIYKDSAFTENTWHHYACTFTSGSQKIYIDGAEVASGTRADTITYYNQEVWIGKGNFGGYWDGLINETVVYNSVLSLAQVQALATTGPNGGPLPPDPMSLSNSSNVVGYWRNDGNVTWTDRSGNGNDGTVYGSPDDLLFKQGYNGQKSTSTGRDGQGFPLSRQNNGAIGFDGTTTYTDVGSVGGAGTFSNCTISVWVNPQNVYGATDYGRIYDGNYEPSIRQRGPTLQLSGTVAASQTYLFYLGADISNYFSAGNMTAPKGQWTNITMTVTTIGTTLQSVNGYVNLTLEGTGSTTDSAKMWVGDIGNLRIGQGYKTGQRFFVGQIGNLQIWDRVLPLSEITQNFNAQRSRFNV